MLVAALMFTASLALLLKSSDWFTDKAEILGKRFGVPPFIIGVTIVAMGTSLPELASSVMAVLNNSSEIIFGNVVGSNIANILLILGISSLFLKREKKIEWNLFHADITFVIASTVILGVVIWDGAFTLGEMLLLLAGFAIYFAYNYDIHKRNGKRKEKGKRPEFKLWDGAVLIASLALIAVSADVLIKSAVALSQITGIGTEIVGLTAIAIGTSLPELAVSIVAVRKGNIEMAIGNVTGSNIFNVFLVPSIAGLFGAIVVPPLILAQSFPYLVIATVMFLSVILDHKMHRFEGAILVLIYILFIFETLS